MDIVEKLANCICSIQQGKAIVVAFDGVDTSGKTTLADKVFDVLHKNGRNCIRISIDKFHNPKELRTRRGELSPEGFFFDSFDYGAIINHVLKPIKNGYGEIIHGIFDYRTESETPVRKTVVTKDLITLFDGIFLNRDELASYWDLSIFLDVSFDTVLKRALDRDARYFGSAEEVERKYTQRYIPGEKLYLKHCAPKDRATIVIDNNDYENRIVVKGDARLE